MGPNGLQATIEKLQDKIRTHYFHLHNIETAVRQVLIDPLLLALGWDVSDPDQVWLEYPIGNGRQADYVLVSNNEPVAVIEAKSLRNSPLGDCIIMKALNYANTLGTKYMVITNGGEWRMYYVPAQQPTILMWFLITQTPVLESSLQALRMWKPNLTSGNPAPASTPPPAWVSLTIPINITSHNANPEHIRFRDGQNQNINPPYAQDILIQTATWLTNNGYLTSATAQLLYPWLRRTPWYIFNTQPQHPCGQDFTAPELVGADVYIETAWEPEQCIVAARALLEHCGVDPDTVQVSFE